MWRPESFPGRAVTVVRVGIAATVKAEAPYLVEWIAFHRTVGIERFFIADNGGDDGTSELLKQLDAAGYITRFDFTGQAAPQLTSYNIIVPLMNDVVDLVAIVDADEFIQPMEKSRVDFALSGHFEDPTVTAVAINWACYGSSNHVRHDHGLVLERFTMRAEQAFTANRHVKSVLRVDRYVSYGNPHVFNITGGRYIDTSGVDIEWDPRAGPGVSMRCLWDKIRINHLS
jgi:Glycosyl transferase family 2